MLLVQASGVSKYLAMYSKAQAGHQRNSQQTARKMQPQDLADWRRKCCDLSCVADAGKSAQAGSEDMQQSAKQATKSAEQTGQEVADLGKQISNILLPGIKLPWQKNGAPAQSQQVSALTCSTYMCRLHPLDVCIGPHSMPTSLSRSATSCCRV